MATLAGSRLTEVHRLAQVTLGVQVVDQLNMVWPLLDPADLDGTFDRWLLAVTRIVAQQRSASARLAGSYLVAFARLELGPGTRMTPVLEPGVDARALTTSMLVTGPVSVKRAMTRGVLLDRAVDIAKAASSAAGMRHALDGGRQTIQQTIRHDDRAVGFQRVTSGQPCEFCSMLAGRGAVYKDDTVDFEAHDGCSCTSEPVFA